MLLQPVYWQFLDWCCNCKVAEQLLHAVQVSAIWTAAENGKMLGAPIWPAQNIWQTAQLCISASRHALMLTWSSGAKFEDVCQAVRYSTQQLMLLG